MIDELNIGMKVIHQTSDFAAIYKPAGVLVHPVSKSEMQTSKEITVVSWALNRFPEMKEVGDRPDIRPGIVHRLDRDTSGVMIVARTQKFFNYFKKLLKQKKVDKVYLALVWGTVAGEGVIDKKIGQKPGTVRQTVHTEGAKMVKSAITRFEPVETFEKDGREFTLVRLHPKTGRTHQLRVHMASIHHSIVGDPRYGKSEDPFGVGRQLLHARSLEFNLPGGERIKLEANLPDDFRNTLEMLDFTFK